MTKRVRSMGLFLVWCHRLICIVLSLCKHACKEVCNVNPGVDPCPLLAQSLDRWWPDFVTFTACKKSRFGLKGNKKAQCVSNRCRDLFERKKYFGVRCTLRLPCPSCFQLSCCCLEIRFWWFYLKLCLPLIVTVKFQLKTRKNQTFETVFHWLSKHFEFCQKYSTVHHTGFSTVFLVFGYPDESLSLTHVWYITWKILIF